MKRFRIAIAVGAIAAVMAIGPRAKADHTFDKLSYLTFSQTVELPGNVMLPAGTYAFKVVDTFGYHHIVQVFDKDQVNLYATIMAIPNYRLTSTEGTVVRFSESAAGAPNAIKEWFYPGDNFGQEFVYPKKRATEIAAAANTPVLAGEIKPAETPAELAKEPIVAVTPENKEVPAPSVVEAPPLIAEARPAPAPEPQTPPAAPAELPKTASPYPALVLIGIGSLAAAAGLRALGRRLV